MREIELELEAARDPRGRRELPLPKLPPRTLSRSVLSTLRSFRPMPEQLLRFAPFPAYHVRTNAFMLDRCDLRRRCACARLSGRWTPTCWRAGARASPAKSRAWACARSWSPATAASTTIPTGTPPRRSGRAGSEGLLVADNQTRSYSQRLLRSPPAALGVRLGAPVGAQPARDRARRRGSPRGLMLDLEAHARAAALNRAKPGALGVVHLVWAPLGPEPLRSVSALLQRPSAGDRARARDRAQRGARRGR